MTDLTTPSNESEQSATAGIGARFKKARLNADLSTKDAATRLRLNEKLILIMENDDFTNDRVPPLFMRGYIRAYAKLLVLNDDPDVLRALKYLQQTGNNPTTSTTTASINAKHSSDPISNLRYTKLFGFLLLAVWVSLTGLWWRDHSTTPAPVHVAENTSPIPSTIMQGKQFAEAPHITLTTPTTEANASTKNTVPPQTMAATLPTTKTPTTSAPKKAEPRMVQSEPGLSGTSDPEDEG